MREFAAPLSITIPTTGNLTDDVVANARDAGDAAGGLAQLDRTYAGWMEGVRALDAEALAAPVGEAEGRNKASPQYCDACFSGDYPVAPFDQLERGFRMKAGSETAMNEAAE